MVSRIAGMAREMIFSRVLGANAVTDAWFQAFIIPNVFRRLFAEGAFSAAFVPMFSKRLHGDGGLDSARWPVTRDGDSLDRDRIARRRGGGACGWCHSEP